MMSDLTPRYELNDPKYVGDSSTDGGDARRRGARPHWSNTPAGMNGYGSTSVKPSTASTRPMLRRRRWAAVSPVPAGAFGGIAGISSRPSRRSTTGRSTEAARTGRRNEGSATSTATQTIKLSLNPVLIDTDTGTATEEVLTSRPAARNDDEHH